MKKKKMKIAPVKPMKKYIEKYDITPMDIFILFHLLIKKYGRETVLAALKPIVTAIEEGGNKQ